MKFDEVSPATLNTVKYLLAGVIGLVVVGAGFLVLSQVARRRSFGAKLAS